LSRDSARNEPDARLCRLSRGSRRHFLPSMVQICASHSSSSLARHTPPSHVCVYFNLCCYCCRCFCFPVCQTRLCLSRREVCISCVPPPPSSIQTSVSAHSPTMAFALPFLGRLHLLEYLGLLASLVFVCFEAFIRVITLALPQPIINLCYRASRRIFDHLTVPSNRSRNRKKPIVQSLVKATDFVELCELYGYAAEEHIVQTKDGYLLGLHRLAWKRGEEGQRINGGPNSTQKKVIFCMHGLLMNSEVWVCLTDKERCLPFQLVDQGYDVWVRVTKHHCFDWPLIYHF